MALRSFAHTDKAHAVIELLADGELLGSISLDVDTLQKLIAKLAKIRASLSHPVPLGLARMRSSKSPIMLLHFCASNGGRIAGCSASATLGMDGLPSRSPTITRGTSQIGSRPMRG
jgi:hypothetical protein